MILKPPRASLFLLNKSLERKLVRLLKLNNLQSVGSFCIQSLNTFHLRVMYPGDVLMPYWGDLEKNLLNRPAMYYLFQSANKNDNENDIYEKIEGIKGGLRFFFYQKVSQIESSFPYVLLGSKQYEDSGVHAPISLNSRFLQLLGTMGYDEQFANWVRTCLPWLL